MTQFKLYSLLNQWLVDRYGSRRGFILAYKYKLLYVMGRYRKYQTIDWSMVDRIVFVCKGNICRSAFAEIVARSLNIEVISCGIDTRNGVPANNNSIRIAAAKGYDLENHKTRTFNSIVFQDNDLLVAMEPWQVEFLEQAFGKKHNYTLMGLWGTHASPYIHDPYGCPDSYFYRCFDYIEKSVFQIAKKIN